MYGTYYSRTVVTPRLLSLDPHFLDSPRILLSLATADVILTMGSMKETCL